jgi:rhodanese-related sulfurtransferase
MCLRAVVRAAFLLRNFIVKFIIDNWYLLVIALGSGAMLAWPALMRSSAAGISLNEAIMLINRQKAVLIDVSDAEIYMQGHAANARNIPLATLANNKNLPSNKKLPIILVSKNATSANRAVSKIRRLGYFEVCSLSGGFKTWVEANLPIETGGGQSNFSGGKLKNAGKNASVKI